jgi:hypothetical protein
MPAWSQLLHRAGSRSCYLHAARLLSSLSAPRARTVPCQISLSPGFRGGNCLDPAQTVRETSLPLTLEAKPYYRHYADAELRKGHGTC